MSELQNSIAMLVTCLAKVSELDEAETHAMKAHYLSQPNLLLVKQELLQLARESHCIEQEEAPAIPSLYDPKNLPLNVQCGDCAHFIRDTVNPRAGIGLCKKNSPSVKVIAAWPTAKRHCTLYQQLL